jgi:adenylate cyclase
MIRSVAMPPGHEELLAVFRNTPNLVGIEKIVDKTILPPPLLKEQKQVGFSDVIIDGDGKIRRGLVAITPTNQETQLSLGAYLAIAYLESHNIMPGKFSRRLNQVWQYCH